MEYHACMSISLRLICADASVEHLSYMRVNRGQIIISLVESYHQDQKYSQVQTNINIKNIMRGSSILHCMILNGHLAYYSLSSSQITNRFDDHWYRAILLFLCGTPKRAAKVVNHISLLVVDFKDVFVSHRRYRLALYIILSFDIQGNLGFGMMDMSDPRSQMI